MFESQFPNSIELLNSCKHVLRLISSLVHLKRTGEINTFIFSENKQGIRECLVSNFRPGLKKCQLYKKFEISPRI